MASAADQYLIFGVLAMQLDFISKDTLAGAMTAWLQNKEQPLGELLRLRGDLDAGQFELLNALVQAHLRKHDNDPSKSLAALDKVPGVMRDIGEIVVNANPGKQPASLQDLVATRRIPAEGEPGRERFNILRVHAEGGVGRVWVARDSELGREVALKEIKENHAHEPHSRARFVREAVITGGLEHPGIVPVYSLGTYQDGRPYYAMRLVRGDHLMAAVERFHMARTGEDVSAADASPLDLRHLLGRFVDVCQAIQYAHDRGVLHRDLKPGNILLGKYGETLVVDWGLAKVMAQPPATGQRNGERQAAPLPPSDDMLPPSQAAPQEPGTTVRGGVAAGAGAAAFGPPSATPPRQAALTDEPPLRVGPGAATMEGIALGTPAFMSPEQAAGRLDLLGPTSDIYSLGATLYCILTGDLPFGSSDVIEVLAKVQRGDFPRPRALNPDVAPALEAICLKAMAREPRKRYASADQLADDVERWLADEPVSAWPEPVLLKVRRWGNRHRTAVATAAAVLLVGTISLVAATLLLTKANTDLTQANSTILKREGETKKANDDLVHAVAAKDVALDKLKKSEEAVRLLAGAETVGRKLADAARQKAEADAATIQMTLAATRFEEGRDDLAQDLMNQVPVTLRHTVWGLLKNTFDGSRFTLYPGRAAVGSLAFTPDAQLLAGAATDGAILLWHARSGQQQHRFPECYPPADKTCIALSPDGQVLAVACDRERTIKMMHVRTGQVLRTLFGHRDGVACVAFSPDGKYLASGSWDRKVRLWNAQTGEEIGILEGHGGAVKGVAFSADGNLVASASLDRTIKLWKIETRTLMRTLSGHRDEVLCVAISPDGRTLASGSADQSIKLWNLTSDKELASLKGHEDNVTALAFSPDGQHLASAGADRTVRLWDARTRRNTGVLRGHQAEVATLAFRPDGQLLASAGADKTVKLWNARTAQEVRSVPSYADPVAVQPGGSLIASGIGDRTIRLWDRRTEQTVRLLRGHQREVTDLAFRPDGRVLASAGADGSVKLWDVLSGNELHTLVGQKSEVVAVAFSRDGQTLASASADHIKLWDGRSDRALRTLPGLRDLTSIAFSADGRLLAAGSKDATVKLWDLGGNVEPRVLSGHTFVVTSVAFHPTQPILASASADGTVKLWDAAMELELRTLRGHNSYVWAVSFSDDGAVLASGGGDGAIKLWETQTGQELRTLRGHVQRVTDLAFYPDGLVSAGADRTTKFWDVRHTHVPRVLRGHQQNVACLAFDATGALVATGSPDKTIKVWNARLGVELRTLAGAGRAIDAVAFSPDSRLVASVGADGIIRLWDVSTGKALHTLPAGSAQPVVALGFSEDGAEVYAQGQTGMPMGWRVADGTRCEPSLSHRLSPPSHLSPDGAVTAIAAGKLVYLVPTQVSPVETGFREWVTRPDAVWHEFQAKSLDEDDQPFGALVHLGSWLAARTSESPGADAAATAAASFAAAHPLLGLAGYLAWDGQGGATFVPSDVFAGVILKGSKVSSARLVAACAAAVQRRPNGVWSRTLQGGALHRTGDHKGAVTELMAALALPDEEGAHLCACRFLAFAHQALGNPTEAKAWQAKTVLPAEVPWNLRLLDRYLRDDAKSAIVD